MLYNNARIFNFLIFQFSNFTVKLENLKLKHLHKILMLYNNTGISNFSDGKIGKLEISNFPIFQFSNFTVKLENEKLEHFYKILMLYNNAGISNFPIIKFSNFPILP